MAMYRPVESSSSSHSAADGEDWKTPNPQRATVFWKVILSNFRSLETCPKELWVSFILKFCESYSYFAVSQILVIYLHTEFGCSDLEAGALYGLWGTAITFWGIATSCINDMMGVRRSLLIGFSSSCIATILLACATSKIFVYIVLLVLLPLGNSLGIPMLSVGIRRYTKKTQRGFAFGLFYSVMNIAAFISGPVIDLLNLGLPSEGYRFGDSLWSANRLVILTTSAVTSVSVFIAAFALREIDVSDDVTTSPDNKMIMRSVGKEESGTDGGEDEVDEGSGDAFDTEKPQSHTDVSSVSSPAQSHDTDQSSVPAAAGPASTSLKITSELLTSKTFWRFSVLTLFLINLKAIFRHLDATLPTYMVRTFGARTPKGLVYSINPFMIIFLTPVVAAMTTTYEHFEMIKWGGYVTALSPFCLALASTIPAAVAFVIILSLGESIWSPRVYDYTMSIAPVGKEASFAALAAAPLFAAKVPVGLLSGYLLSTYMPENGPTNGRTLWLIIGLTTLSSPILVTLTEKWIREPSTPPPPEREPTCATANEGSGAVSFELSPMHRHAAAAAAYSTEGGSTSADEETLLHDEDCGVQL